MNDICATASRELGEPLAATAATARTWLLVEQPGPWGRKAVTASHLDTSVGRELERRAEGTGVRVALVRAPGRHADERPRPSGSRSHTDGPGRPLQVFTAHTAPGRAWVRHTTVDHPAALLDLDMPLLGSGEHGGFGTPWTGDPLVLVCTNGKRDRCCALLGRPLVADLAVAGGVGVWEISHIGGHRFAPTMLVLPYGYAYGRVGAHAAKDTVEAVRHGRMVIAGCRGRSTWDRPGQAAELAVRGLTGEDRADALVVTGSTAVREDRWHVLVRHTDGRTWSVEVSGDEQTPPRPESCGAALGTPLRMTATSVTATDTAPGPEVS